MIVIIFFKFLLKRGGYYFSMCKESVCKYLRIILIYLYISMLCNEGVVLMMYGYLEKWLEGMIIGEGIVVELCLGIVNGYIVEGMLFIEN